MGNDEDSGRWQETVEITSKRGSGGAIRRPRLCLHLVECQLWLASDAALGVVRDRHCILSALFTQGVCAISNRDGGTAACAAERMGSQGSLDRSNASASIA